jgi:hypothetical protein
MTAMSEQERLLIGETWVPATAGTVRDVLDPASGEVIAQVADAGRGLSLLRRLVHQDRRIHRNEEHIHRILTELTATTGNTEGTAHADRLQPEPRAARGPATGP